MKLAIFVDEFPVLSQTFVLNQIRGLIEADLDVTVLARIAGNDDAKQHPDFAFCQSRAKIQYLNPEPRTKLPKLLHRIGTTLQGLVRPATYRKTLSSLNARRFGHLSTRLILPPLAAKSNKHLKFDVILCHFGTGGVLMNCLRELQLIEGKIATIFHGRDVSSEQELMRYARHYSRLFTATELLLPITELWKTRLNELGCPADKLRVHRMGVSLDTFDFSEKPEETGKPFKLFSAARFTEKKGLKYALKAVAQVSRSVDLVYSIAGYGEQEQELKELVKRLQIEDRVNFIGPINQTEVLAQMIESHAYLLPSVTAANGDMEGLPVSIMEAMAVGTPVISTFHSGIPELITHQENGLLSEERNVEQLTENIKLCADSPGLRHKLALRARAKIESEYSIARLNAQLVKLLKGLMESQQ